MSIVWTIEVSGGATKPLASWGIQNAVLTRRNLATDTLTFRIPREDVLDDPTFTYGQTLILRANDGEDNTIRFRGTVSRLPAVGNARQEADLYEVSGPWWLLSRLVYQQAQKVKTEDFSSLVSVDTTRVLLGMDATGNRITTDAQIRAIIAYAVSQGVAVIEGVLPAFVNRHLDERRDITCAEAIRLQLDVTPDCGTWFDYSTAVPSLNIQRRALKTAKEFDLEDEDLIQSFELTPRSDLVPPGVVFIFQSSAPDGEDTPQTWQRYTRQEAGITSGVGVITATIPLMGLGTTNVEPLPIENLALAYYTALQVTPWEGSLVMKGRDCDVDISPAHVVNLANGRTAWAAMRAVVQSVVEELQTGVTLIEIGPSEHLSPQDFVSQVRFGGNPQTTNIHTTKPNNVDEEPNPNQGKDPGTVTTTNRTTTTMPALDTAAITVCNGDEEITLTVYTPAAPV